MDDGSPALEVGFVIDTGGSFDELTRLQELMDSTEVKVLREAAKIERATSGMVNLAGATASLSTFGNAATRELQSATREMAKVEKAGEALSRQLDRQTATFGKTREELRATKVETAALAAEQQGLTELAGRLRTQEAALYAQEFAAARAARFEAEAAAQEKDQAAQRAVVAAQKEAQAVREAALAYQMFEARAREGAAALRDQEASAARDAAALARLREMLDPAAAGQDRLNRELADARRLFTAAGASAEELARIEQLLSKRHGEAVRSSGAAAASMQNFGFQLQDFEVQVIGGTSALRAFAQQFPQAVGALTGFEGKLGAVGKFLAGGWGIALTLAITLLAGFADKLFETGDHANKAADALKNFQDRQSDIGNFIDATTGKLIEQNKELLRSAILLRQKQLAENDVAITTGRNAAFAAARKTYTPNATGAGVGTGGAPLMSMNVVDPDVQKAIAAAGGDVDKLSAAIFKLAQTRRPDLKTLAIDITSQASQAILATRENEKLGKELRALNGDTTALAGSTTALIAKQVALATATTPLAKARAELAIVEQGASAADKAGGAALVKYRADLTKATQAVNAAEAAQKAQTAARREANSEALHGAKLGREAEAILAQTRNLYALADAYGASGSQALIAEAREKAESQAIKERGDIEAAVARQIGLMIAQRVADAAKGTAAMRDQAVIQEQVNAEVAAGNVSAQRASELVRNRIADLPLLAALEAANASGNVSGAEKAADALDAQRAARDRLTASERAAALAGAMAQGNDQLEMLRVELALVDATDAARVHALATLKATQEAAANGWAGKAGADYVAQQVAIADAAELLTEKQRNYNDQLSFTADKWDLIARNVQRAAQGMADAFGAAGRAIGDMAAIYANYQADRARLDEQHLAALKQAGTKQADIDRVNTKFALASSTQQIGAFGDMASAAKGFFDEKSKGYKALMAAERVFRAFEFAMSLRSMVQNALETAGVITNAAAKATAEGTAGIAKQSQLPFPWNIAAMAATGAALVAAGIAVFSGGGSGHVVDPGNTGTGTVLGDSTAKSESIKNALDALKEVDLLTNVYSRQMADSLKSIDSQIGGVAAVLVRSGDISANDKVSIGYNNSTGKTVGTSAGAIVGAVAGSILGPVGSIVGGLIGSTIGKLIGSLFGTRTDVTASGIYGGPQSLGSVLNGGFNAQAYSDVTKTHKFLGIVTGRSYSTQYGSIDPSIANQFTLILKQFDAAILAAAGPLGVATSEIENRLNGFVVNIGKIDLKGLTGEQIQEKLNAIFGAAADNMANAAFPGITQFQKVGEGAFETLVRVSSTVESVTTALDQMGNSAQSLSVAAKMGLASQFESVSAFSQAVGSYFSAFYTKEEQAAAQTAQFTKIFASLGLTMPSTLAAFRSLVEAQDLTTTAGQATYATLLQLAPAFADLQSALAGAKSAADIASERTDLQRQLLQLQGDEAALRALDLAKIDPANRALQQQIWALQDAQTAAKAAKDLADAWKGVGDSIMDEVKRIRGLTGTTGDASFASLLGQFNAANLAARSGDQDAAKSLPGLSQSLLKAAEDAATSRQELDRIRAQTAGSLEATYAAISGLGTASGAGAKITDGTASNAALLSAASLAQTASTPAAANDDLLTELKALRSEVASMRSENTSGHAATASNTGSIKRTLDTVTQASGGEAISVASAA